MTDCQYNIGCLVPNCGRIRSKRGRCVYHYDLAKTEVNAGRATWQQYIDEGTALPAMTREERNKWNSR